MEENSINTDTHSPLEDGGLTSLQAGWSSVLSRNRDTNSSAPNRKRERGEGERMGGLGEGSWQSQYIYMYGACYCVETYSGPALSSPRLSVDCKSSDEGKTRNIGKVIAVRLILSPRDSK